MLTIDSIMRKPVVTAERDETAEQAAQKMHEAGVGAVVVVREDQIEGIFTERDLLALVAEGLDPRETKLADVATSEVVTVEAGARLRSCAETLRDLQIRHIPVVDDGRPVGILSARDFYVAAAEGFEKYIERARFDAELRDQVDPYDHMGGSYGR